MKVLEHGMIACPPGFVSRPMLKSDLPKVLEIEREVHFTPWGGQAFLDAMTTGDVLPVVLANKEVAGYGVLKILWREAELLNVSVAAPWRRQGLGRFLVATLLQAALRHGAPQVFLEVRESNTGAQILYRQMGFEIIGSRKAYYACPEGKREDAQLMRWQEKGGASAA
ncbi:MAG: ribosomal protein S18-alanine N-acetyltransferase [Burkholderiales bacterium]|jgi:ribosomal-protein-alanine N-acetyltransferase|nr:ribosomal protein S18-alanine N-acetyltransferase [Burkholderiales bacterium]